MSPEDESRAGRTRENARVSAIELLVEREAAPLLDYFNRRAPTTEDPADLLGETLFVVWRRERAVPEDPTEARMWLYGVARKVLAGHHRSNRRRRALTERLSSELLTIPAPSPDSMASDIRSLLKTLDETDQEIIRLVYWDGFNLDETASILSMRPGTVRSRHSRARARLKALVTESTLDMDFAP